MDKQPENRTRLASLLRNEDGVMAVVFAALLPVFVVMAALAIDMGYAYWKRNILQVTASASALAGAGVAMDDGTAGPGGITYNLIDKDGDGVPDNDDSNGDGVKDGAVILIEALAYAEKTISNENVLAAVDVLPGNWDPATRIFTMAGTWDLGTQVFTEAPAAYDTATGTFTAVSDPVVSLNAVMTTTRRADDGPNNNPLPLFLAAAVGLPAANINTTAIAGFSYDQPPPLEACITALNTTDRWTFYINGTAEVYAPGCNIDVWSEDLCAIRAVGKPEISVIDAETEDGSNDGSINVAGPGLPDEGYCDSPNVEWYPDDPVGTYDPPDEIPFAYLDPTSSCNGSSDYCGLVPDACGGTEPETRFSIDNGETLVIGSAGDTTTFCGGVRISGANDTTVVFEGNIVISGGELDIAGSVAIESGDSGTGFYLMDGSRLNMHGGPGGNGSVGLIAQHSGPLKDFIFFEDPGNDIEPFDMSLRGTPFGAFDGLIFFQNSDAEWKGTADGLLGVTDCTVLIADEIYFNGTTQLATDLACGNRELPPAALGNLTLRLWH